MQTREEKLGQKRAYAAAVRAAEAPGQRQARLAWAAEYRGQRRGELASKARAYHAANRDRISEYRTRPEVQERQAAYMAEWRKKNRERLHAYAAKEREENREAILARQKAWRDAKREHRARFAKANADKWNAYGAKRRAAKLKATPAWLTPEQHDEMLRTYSLGSSLGLEVDHIVPLAGKNVCGLHVPWNLQLLTVEANRSKGNRHDG